jgi:hypothetical protein
MTMTNTIPWRRLALAIHYGHDTKQMKVAMLFNLKELFIGENHPGTSQYNVSQFLTEIGATDKRGIWKREGFNQ